jgi:hypothetical protein
VVVVQWLTATLLAVQGEWVAVVTGVITVLLERLELLIREVEVVDLISELV